MVKTKKGALIKIFVGFGVHKREGGHNFSIYKMYKMPTLEEHLNS